MRIARQVLIGMAAATMVLAPGIANSAGRSVKILPNTTYIGETTQELAYRKFEHIAGLISFHLDGKRQIDGFTLNWRCDGNKFNRKTYATPFQEPPFEAVPLKGRSISFSRELSWYDFDPGRESRKGTARVTVKGQFLKRRLKRGRDYPLPLSYSSIARGTISIVDGGCRVHARWELNADNTQRGQSIKSF